MADLSADLTTTVLPVTEVLAPFVAGFVAAEATFVTSRTTARRFTFAGGLAAADPERIRKGWDVESRLGWAMWQ